MGVPGYAGGQDPNFINADAAAAYYYIQSSINGNLNDNTDNGNPDIRLVACKHLGSDVTDIDDLDSNTADFRQIMGGAGTDPDSVGLDADRGVGLMFADLGTKHAFRYGSLDDEDVRLGIQALDADGNLAVENADGDIVTAVDLSSCQRTAFEMA